ncbi:ribonuclease H-like domain, reverse transcriptase, RNA-dependent DNA polymerase [Tanacetum coccineum]
MEGCFRDVLMNRRRAFQICQHRRQDGRVFSCVLFACVKMEGYLANGASNHMTGIREHFKELDEKVSGKVRFGDGSYIEIKGKGSIIIECDDEKQRIISHVYYIPDLKSNLLSLGQFTEIGCKVVMEDDELRLYDMDNQIFMKVTRQKNRLYKANLRIGTPVCLLANLKEDTWLWHARLGHLNFESLKSMAQRDLVHGIPAIKHTTQICDVCLIGKHSRAPFPKKAKARSTSPLDLVYGDLCGPITPPTPSGKKYIFLLVDDYSRYMWAYFLSTKDQAFDTFKEFKKSTENELRTTLKMLRTDRGGEFTSNEFTQYCKENGIARQLTAPYSPQQNAVVERRNRTIMSMTRCMMKATNMPQNFWAEAVRHAIHILNSVPTKALEDITPYEAIKQRKPNLENLRIFGCIAYAKVPSQHLTKLDDRSIKMVYLGNEQGSKAYRLFDPTTQRVCVSRDVKFKENETWDWKDYIGEHTNDEPEWTNFNIGDPEVTNEHPDQETQPNEDDNEFPDNNDDDDYASPTRDSPSHSQTPHTPSTRSSEVNSQVTPNTSTQSYYQSDHDSIQIIDSPSHFDHTPLRGFRTLKDLYENTEELLLVEDEPKNYKEASSDQKWIEAMKVELDSINRNNTWELTTLPKGHKAIGLKWVFKTKKDANGNIIKHKARLVAKGYIQQHGIDFEEVFAPVARMETIRLLLAIAANNKWEVHHLDVKSAFLHGDLKEEVYVTQPEGFIKRQDNGKVYRLIKALYGLRQAPRAWNIKLDNTLKSLDFKKCALEQAIYTKKSKDSILSTLLIGVYVDDLIITGTPKKEIDKFKAQMEEKFEMSDLGLLAYYLGIEVTQTNGDISIKQSAYASKILKEAGMLDCNETLIPMDPGTRLTKINEGTMVNSTEYRSLIGCLRYLLHTRPDLSYSVGLLSRFMQEPREQHMKAIRQVLRYVKGTKDYGITYKHNGGNKIHGFSDSSYGVNTQEGKGTTGIIFYYGESPISWNTQKQATVALSSCESEFIAATAAATQALWLKRLLSKLTHSQEEKITIQVDNKSAIALMKNPVFHGRSKHIDTKYHFIRECVEREDIQVEFVSGEYQKADILTKALPKIRFLTMRQLIGLKELPSSVCD